MTWFGRVQQSPSCQLKVTFLLQRARVATCREIERTGGLTSGVRKDILFVLENFISLARDEHMSGDLGEVFSQILVRLKDVCTDMYV